MVHVVQRAVSRALGMRLQLSIDVSRLRPIVTGTTNVTDTT
jgi:hypothetical protein